MRPFLVFLLSWLVPLVAIAQSSILTTTGSSSTSTTSTTGSGTTTSTNSNTNLTTTGGSVYTTNNGTINYDNRIGSGYAPGTNNPYATRDTSTDAISDVDTPRKGFDDPRDPWDGRYTNDNPKNYSNGQDDLAAHAAGRAAFTNRTSTSNYTAGGVNYGPVHTH